MNPTRFVRTVLLLGALVLTGTNAASAQVPPNYNPPPPRGWLLNPPPPRGTLLRPRFQPPPGWQIFSYDGAYARCDDPVLPRRGFVVIRGYANGSCDWVNFDRPLYAPPSRFGSPLRRDPNTVNDSIGPVLPPMRRDPNTIR